MAVGPVAGREVWQSDFFPVGMFGGRRFGGQIFSRSEVWRSVFSRSGSLPVRYFSPVGSLAVRLPPPRQYCSGRKFGGREIPPQFFFSRKFGGLDPPPSVYFLSKVWIPPPPVTLPPVSIFRSKDWLSGFSPGISTPPPSVFSRSGYFPPGRKFTVRIFPPPRYNIFRSKVWWPIQITC